VRVEFLNSLDLRKMHDNVWELIAPFYASIVNDDGSQVEVMIPRGFMTDLCSVPRAPFSYLLFGGIGEKAGVLHDALYSPWPEIKVVGMHSREPIEVTREWADAVLYAALEACNVGWFKRWMMYKGVRLAGWQFYKVKADQT
jgi:hypothetical protein